MNESTPTAGFPLSLLITLGALAVVLVIAWLAIRLLARIGTGGIGRAGRLAIVQSVTVGSRERVVLLRLDDRELLVGVSAGGITRLDAEPGRAPPVGTALTGSGGDLGVSATSTT